MLIKEIDDKTLNDKFAIAGHKAEKEMEFFLKREFSDREDICIVNDLRLVDDKDSAQIDSLIIHPFGFIIIELKSVTQKIKVNKLGEWTRIHDGKEMGIASPIEQAKRQKKFLINYLNQHAKKILDKNSSLLDRLISDNSYDKLKFDILVAISSSGIIIRDGAKDDNILKSEFIPEKIESLISKYEKESNSIFPLKKSSYKLDNKTILEIAKFLARSHKKKDDYKSKIPQDTKEPKSEVKESKAKKILKPKRDTKANSKYICSKCKSSNIFITYGKYGYYFKCKDCSGNTAIKEYCPKCKEKMKITKSKDNFYKECPKCKDKKLFFVNRV